MFRLQNVLNGNEDFRSIRELTPLRGVYSGIFYSGDLELTRLFRLKAVFDPYIAPAPYSELDSVIQSLSNERFSFLFVRKPAQLAEKDGRPLYNLHARYISSAAFETEVFLAYTVKPDLSKLPADEVEAAKKIVERAQESFEKFIVFWDIFQPEFVNDSYVAVSILTDIFGFPPPPEGEYSFDDNNTLLEYLFPADLRFSNTFFTIGDTYYAVVSVRKLMGSSFSTTFYNLLAQLHFPFAAVITVSPFGESRVHYGANLLDSLRDMLTFKTKKMESVIKEEEVLRSYAAKARGETEYFNWSCHFLLRAGSEGELASRVEALLSALRQMRVAAYRETFALGLLFPTILPPFKQMKERTITMTTQNIVDFLPVHTTQAHFVESDALLLLDRNFKLNSMDPFERAAANNNTIITGATGQGKSFFVKYLLMSATDKYRQQLRVWILDVTGEYLKLTQMMGGDVLYVDDKEARFSIDPFKLAEATPAFISIFLDILTDHHYDELDLYLMADQYLKAGRSNPSFRDFIDYFSERIGEEKMDRFLKVYMRFREFFDHPYFLDLSASRFVNIVIEKTMEDVKLHSLIFFYLFFFLRRSVYRFLEDFKIIVLDEAWKYLQGSEGARRFIEETVREIRKYKGILITVFQALADLEGSPEALVLANNSGRKILFNQMPADIFSQIGLDREWFERMRIHTKKSGSFPYSEMVVVEEVGMEKRIRILRLAVPPQLFEVFQTENLTQLLEGLREKAG